MRIEQPPGNRSCAVGGSWDVCRDSAGGSWVARDLADLEAELTPELAAMTKEEMRGLMLEAQSGDLRYGQGRHCDVELMASTTDILELRLSDRGGLHLRLFFSEPQQMPDLMIAVGFFWKRPGPIDLPAQTAAAQRASMRLHRWSLTL